MPENVSPVKLATQASKSISDSMLAPPLSVILYGSAASGDFVQGRSDVNLLVVIEEASYDVLEKVRNATTPLETTTRISTLVIEEKELQKMLRVFPLEFLSIIENHLTLYGHKIASSWRVDPSNVKTVLEYEAMSKLVHVRQSYLLNHTNEIALGTSFISITKSASPLLSGMLFLKGRPCHQKLDDKLVEFSSSFQINTNSLKNSWLMRRGKAVFAGEQLKKEYLQAITILTEIVNKSSQL